jgi:hypothetical protein
VKNEIVASLLAFAIIGSAGAGYLVGVANSHHPTASVVSAISSTLVVSTTTTTTVTSRYTPVVNNEVFLMQVNGSYYWADDVSKDTEVGLPGYSFFYNGSITFDGVRFTTICPPNYLGCPNPYGNVTSTATVLMGVMSFTMTFPDKTTENGFMFTTETPCYYISHHSPRAGMLVEYVGGYSLTPVPFAVFLLVAE